MKRGRKTNSTEYEARMPEIFHMILYEKLNSTEFREEAARRFNITERSAEALWSKARNRIKDKFKEQTDQILADHLARHFDLLTRCRQDNNKRTEIEVLNSLTKLYGFDTKKIDVTSAGEKVSININLTE